MANSGDYLSVKYLSSERSLMDWSFINGMVYCYASDNVSCESDDLSMRKGLSLISSSLASEG